MAVEETVYTGSRERIAARCLRCGQICRPIYNSVVNSRGDGPCPCGVGIDGAVVKFDGGSNRQNAGTTSKAPRWAIAFKYAADSRLTRLNAITIQVGRTGALTPVAELEPVFVGGTTVSRATVSNPGQVAAKDIRVGDMVWVRRAGDVIPEVTGHSAEHRTADSTPWEGPTACPRCGAPVDKSSLRWRCSTPCSGIIKTLTYFCSRKAMDIEGLSEERLRAMVEADMVSDAADLYTLTAGALAELPRMGTKSATNLLGELEASKAQPLARVLTALGIEWLGTTLSRRVAPAFGTLAAVREASAEQLAEIEGFGDVRAQAVVDGLVANSDLIDRLVAVGVTAEAEIVEKVVIADNPILGKKVCVSGSVPGMSRDEAKLAVERLGGTPTSSISANTDLLIAGDGAGSKLAKAQSLGVAVLDAESFAALLAA